MKEREENLSFWRGTKVGGTLNRMRANFRIFVMRGEARSSPGPSSVRSPEMCSMLSIRNDNGTQTLKSIFMFSGTQYQYHK